MDRSRGNPAAILTFYNARYALFLGMCLCAFISVCQGQIQEQGASEEERALHQGYSANELAEALEDILGSAQDNRVYLEKKASQIPRCNVGERCAAKYGPRIGKLCDCLRGASCNTFLLRCY
ncbi:cocaine- and amphetamine-regulated transcript protein-like [Protopterus annectens]|uniref:cocaine- and amphetamine-regulated transcript protein-like n=1 Tax=Protopterus annectens TaxID=7888 RepID=UPI001CFA79F3|nr:cocaine- and amphetamine-regulated transcript protein-like [Protopterus annectens]